MAVALILASLDTKLLGLSVQHLIGSPVTLLSRRMEEKNKKIFVPPQKKKQPGPVQTFMRVQLRKKETKLCLLQPLPLVMNN